MTKYNKLIAWINKILFAGILLFGITIFNSCDNGGDKDPEPELYDLSGVYIFNEAILQTSLEIPGLPISIPAGTDITDEMSNGLLAEAPCNDQANGAIELKSNFKLFFTCIGENNELDAGTWSIDDARTELTLNLSVSSGNLALKVEELVIDETNDLIAGKIRNFPITKTLLAGFLADVPGGDVILAGIDDSFTILVDVDIEFKKILD